MLKDLKYVIVKGGQLYKKQNALWLLVFGDLPRIILVKQLQVPLKFLANDFGFYTESVEQSQLDSLDK